MTSCMKLLSLIVPIALGISLNAGTALAQDSAAACKALGADFSTGGDGQIGQRQALRRNPRRADQYHFGQSGSGHGRRA